MKFGGFVKEDQIFNRFLAFSLSDQMMLIQPGNCIAQLLLTDDRLTYRLAKIYSFCVRCHFLLRFFTSLERQLFNHVS